MKSRTIYQCEYCLSEYKTSSEAHKCEADCLKLSLEEYMEYLELLAEEKSAFGIAACASNDEIRERCDKALRAVIEFQEKYGITDSKW